MSYKIIPVLFLFILSFTSNAQKLSAEEKKLYDIIMSYRKQLNLPVIPLSKSLTLVAQTHVNDLYLNNPVVNGCNMHSWSSKGKWTACCYKPDHSNAKGMWDKPRELTSYVGNGYEIAYSSSEDATAVNALELWKKSSGHHALIINQGVWKNKWNAIGIGICRGYACVWFGNEVDK